MQPAAVSQDRNSDLATTVVATMRQLGVVAIPRNYEIFYEALTGTNPELSLAVVALSNRRHRTNLTVSAASFRTEPRPGHRTGSRCAGEGTGRNRRRATSARRSRNTARS